ncbi:glycosyl hydrolase family 18 protein [Vibrio aestuarianus]|uniref:glycosyl hydrolase family 18 protein n=2 Tax=Vibrio aestuarianus TaxID=28171 RepID=UPI0014453BA2|nr:glycosyl hydrolase family 18 protein [Vibrio aestuarianus]MDE1214858.1 glycosyl hydrolase family 18 protein [Vibrio aestuarianus]MDE1217811.1 glycosyl hydrolase family 18 protein [Vibrio aestuarianus]MDE1261980.1 glycosyl hydrolase family 18 protein [Vibrio aestuarianus]MDE1269035.1 glycosyl hydrolase family 18 protein [Vibrio aestuarianus]MDE1276276.1 glycosyl hydrolase family 18 protein [Vibrio aestuarianus]
MKKYKLGLLSVCVMSALGTAPMAAAMEEKSAPATGLSKYKIDSSKNAKYSNTYKKDASLPEVSAYFSNWTHYEQGFQPNLEELAKNDVVILSFFGLCGTEIGDPNVTGGVQGLRTSCAMNNQQKFEVSSTDLYADIEKQFPGFDMSWKDVKWLTPNPNGMLGVMQKLHEEKGTRIAMTIFGWSLSNIASDAVKPENRPIFINSLIKTLEAYPFIGQLDIDWEYPGVKGAQYNVFDPINDARNYREFVAELRQALDKINRSDVKIGVASGAPTDKIDAAELDKLVQAGVDTIHLMTYDFFGQWDDQLNHHTNLYSSDESKWSADKAIQYMINDLGIPSKNIQLGYANYSRNAIATGDVQPSPLKGNFTPNGNTVGSFEGASSNINDLLANFMKADQNAKLTGINGYQLYTDAESNADFLYNDTNKVFVSLDTPRSVFVKAQYVKKHNLGGLFNWMGDPDEGLMLNAAREGLGYEVENQVFDMTSTINSCGVNITEEKCTELTYDDGHNPSIIISDQEAVFEVGGTYPLSAKVSGIDATEIKSSNWTVTNVSGVDASTVVINDATNLETAFTVNVSEEPAAHVAITFALNVELKDGTKLSDKLNYTLKVNESVPVIADITHSAQYVYGSGEAFSFVANASDKADDQLGYEWTVESQYAKPIGSTYTQRELLIDTSSLVNKPAYDVVTEVTVTNKFGNTDSMKATTTTVIGNADLNNAPIASFKVLSTRLEEGATIELQSTSQDELIEELTYQWRVTLDGQEIIVDQTKGAVASFVAAEAGDYEATLVVTDVFDVESSESQTITVTEVETTWDPNAIYNTGDTVIHNSITYTAKWWTQGDVPGQSDVWAEEDTGVIGEWNASKVYNTNDKAIYQGINYTAQWWTQGDVPGQSSVWVADKDEGQPGEPGQPSEWSASQVYTAGDQATYNGKVYQAKWWVQGEKPDQSAAWALVK